MCTYVVHDRVHEDVSHAIAPLRLPGLVHIAVEGVEAPEGHVVIAIGMSASGEEAERSTAELEVGEDGEFGVLAQVLHDGVDPVVVEDAVGKGDETRWLGHDGTEARGGKETGKKGGTIYLDVSVPLGKAQA